MPNTTKVKQIVRDAVDARLRQMAERQHDEYIADCAIAYCAARHAMVGAEPTSWQRDLVEIDRTYYNLMKACGFEQEEEPF